MKWAARDARDDALATERFAEDANDPDAWLVAADAWEEADEPTYAWYARLRASGRGSDVLPRRLAEDIRDRHDRLEDARRRLDPRRFDRGGGYTLEEVVRIRVSAGVDRNLSGAELGMLEYFDFMTRQPDRLFAYHEGAGLRTFAGNLLATLYTRGATRRVGGYGGGSAPSDLRGRTGTAIQHVVFRGENGFYYHGTCNLETGSYCRLRRGKAWFDPKQPERQIPR